MRRALTLLLSVLLAIGAAAIPAGAATAAAQPDPSTSQPVYRFWSSAFDNAHFYTVSRSEAQNLHSGDPNWTYEGQDFRVWPVGAQGCPAGTVGVHRFWSSAFESHFFTTSSSEAAKVRQTDKNWSYEGTAFCTAASNTSGTVPVYRFWSATFKKHFYTANASEAQQLRTSDRNWTYEGIALYAPSSGPAAPELTGPAAPKPAPAKPQPAPAQPAPSGPVAPVPGTWNCPSGYPVKGNHSSSGEWIYHVPGGQYYGATNPEECFATPQDAEKAGYRASKR
ncbi:sunset domain-containing protein [Microbacterium gilvum]|uniref:DUF5648 domain-containing protein n=1 Tax=Microbacterium gilvum TaxID=1336204 RepID=A0ABP9APP6_9MICO